MTKLLRNSRFDVSENILYINEFDDVTKENIKSTLLVDIQEKSLDQLKPIDKFFRGRSLNEIFELYSDKVYNESNDGELALLSEFIEALLNSKMVTTLQYLVQLEYAPEEILAIENANGTEMVELIDQMVVWSQRRELEIVIQRQKFIDDHGEETDPKNFNMTKYYNSKHERSILENELKLY